LVDDVGTVERVEQTGAGRTMRIASRYSELTLGESIALNGACLTVLELGEGWFSVAAVVTTLGRTTIGAWAAGHRVNLERAMRLGDRLGGHLVQGHVDDVGLVEHVRRSGDAMIVDVRLPAELELLMVLHGSVAVDGVSLTVNALPAPGILQLSLIEYTWRHTTLGDLVRGDRVHLEADMMGKYARRLITPFLPASGLVPLSGPTSFSGQRA
jgi:riboflavin synthase